MIETGDIAPDFTLPREDGSPVTLSGFRPGKVVLYFYPRDDTPGCTTESIGFSANLSDFEAAGAKVFGISRDTMAKHDKFVAKHALTVPLLSDEEGSVTEAYGVWVEKNMYGRTYMGIARQTFLIGPDSSIIKSWKKVRVKGHAEDVLDHLPDPTKAN